MRIYCVGGAVRDELLGLPVRDRDWVVVGATPEQLAALGFRPVGRDFPVFLHPQTHEEYALARTERKTGPGYHGFAMHFSPDVTLEDDLRRRDLTINAMARDGEGELVDPYSGRRDLRERILRHVSEAFAEDPVRILRVARFAARFHDFTVAPETMALMRAMVAAGEVDALVAERVWQELARGLMESHPSRMIDVLQECGAFPKIMPELAPSWDEAAARGLDAAARASAALPVRFAVLLLALGAAQGERASDQVATVSDRLRAPIDCREVARLLTRELRTLEGAAQLDAEALAGLVERLDGLRRPERMEQVLQGYFIVHPRPGLDRVRDAAQAMGAVDAGAIARAGPPATIRERVRAARVQAVAEALSAGTPGA